MDKTRLVKIIKSTLFSVAIGAVLMLVLLAVFSFILTKTGFNCTVATVIAFLIIIVTGFISGYINALILKEKGILLGLLSSGVLVLIMLVIKVCFFDGPPTALTFVKFVILIVSAIIGGISGVNKKNKNKYAKLKC